ncbi:MAG: RHS repeat-associated core domain-containing protein [Anaerolineae bacterium]|nr:RHS repeat-associated core domain-containing protein [Anaerolineae bacterium]
MERGRTSPPTTLTERGRTGHHENRDIGLTYMNARYYIPGLGRFLTADTIVPSPTNPQSHNRYSYVLGNPLVLVDPTGHCPAPPSGSGNIICVALFIQDSKIIFRTGDGDGRSFNSNSSEWRSRGYAYIYLDEIDVNGNVRVEFYLNDSITIFGDFEADYTQSDFVVTVNPLTGQIKIVYNLRNGFTARVYRDDTDTFESMLSECHGVPECGGGFIPLGPAARVFIPDINGTIILTPNAFGGYDVFVDRDPYPSLEVYQYYDGSLVRTLIRLSPDGWGGTMFGPILGLNPLAPNQISIRDYPLVGGGSELASIILPY